MWIPPRGRGDAAAPSSFPSFLRLFLETAVAGAFATVIAALVAQSIDVDAAVACASVAFVVFVAASIGSVVGFAFSLLAAAGLGTLGMMSGGMVAVLVVCSTALQTYCVIQLWSILDWRRTLPFLVPGAAVLPFGVWLLRNTPAAAITLILGSLLVAYALYRLFGGHGGHGGQVDRSGTAGGNRWGAILTGAAGGLSGGLAAAPAIFPAMWCNLSGWDKVRTRSVLQPYILAMQCMALYWMHGTSVAPRADSATMAAVAAALLGARFGTKIFRRMSDASFMRWLEWLLLASGLVMVGRSL